MGTGGTRGWGGSHGGKRTHVAVGGTWSWQRPLGMRRHVGWTEPRRTEGTQVTGGDTEVARPPWGQGHVAGGDTRGANARAPPAPQPITASPPRDVTHRGEKYRGGGVATRGYHGDDASYDHAPSGRYRSRLRPLTAIPERIAPSPPQRSLSRVVSGPGAPRAPQGSPGSPAPRRRAPSSRPVPGRGPAP